MPGTTALKVSIMIALVSHLCFCPDGRVGRFGSAMTSLLAFDQFVLLESVRLVALCMGLRSVAEVRCHASELELEPAWSSVCLVRLFHCLPWASC